MNDKFFYKLLYNFPQLFPEGEESQIYVPKGWEQLVYQLCVDIMEYLGKNPNPCTHVEQIKEKFGYLRFYTVGKIHEPIHDIIARAEEKSGHICEVTGEPGNLYEKDGWLKTLCEEQAQTLGYKKVDTFN